MEIGTARLLLRPLSMADAPVIRDVIFSDPEVAKGLAHDISDPGARLGFAEAWCRDLGVDGGGTAWADGGIGAFAIMGRTAELGAGLLGLIGFFGAAPSDPDPQDELFYALGRRHHGKRVMSEAGAAVMAACAGRLGDLYAVYWALLNPASGRVLAGLGFRPDGHMALLEEYDADRVRSLAGFELWRVREAGADLDRIAVEAATKIGHIVREGVMTRAEAAAALDAAIGGRPGVEPARVARALDLGESTPGVAMMRFRAGGAA